MENNMILEYQRGKDADALRGIIQENKGLVFSVANGFKSIYKHDSFRAESVITKDDVVQYGFIGLIMAAAKYEPEKGADFGPFAAFYIKAYIIRELQNNGFHVRFPVYLHGKLSMMRKFQSAYYAEQGRDPSDDEIMLALGIDEKELETIKRADFMQSIISLNKPTGEDDAGTVADSIPCSSDQIADFEENLFNQELKEAIWKLVDSLDNEKPAILHKVYEENKTVKETAAELNLSIYRATSLKNSALLELGRGKCADVLVDFIDSYECADSIAFHGGIGRFRNRGESSTEQAAIMRTFASVHAKKELNRKRNAVRSEVMKP